VITDALALAPALAGLATDGWARVGRRFDAAALAGLRARLDAIMDGAAPRDGLFFQHDAASGAYEDLALGRGWIGPSRAYRKLEGLERDPVVRVWLDDPGLAQLAHAVIGPEVALARAVVWTKAARGDAGPGGTELPWHQDGGPFWGLSAQPPLWCGTARGATTPRRRGGR
jgi:phytanoyl-CoA hydroxylase